MVVQRNAVSLDGRIAVVTGGGEGIGRGIAAGLAALGVPTILVNNAGGTSAAGGWYHHPDDGHYILGPG